MASAVLSVLPWDVEEKIWKHLHRSCIQEVNQQIQFLASVAEVEGGTMLELFDAWSGAEGGDGIREGLDNYDDSFARWREVGYPDFMSFWVGDGFYDTFSVEQ
jgi:hypothetical protein